MAETSDKATVAPTITLLMELVMLKLLSNVFLNKTSPIFKLSTTRSVIVPLSIVLLTAFKSTNCAIVLKITLLPAPEKVRLLSTVL